jgi:cyclic pyranopterin phosphate synthase
MSFPVSIDRFARRIDYLRISVTDRCNERCLYCMPEGFRGWKARAETLSDGEILRVVRVAAGLGFRKFRVTGGEPLVRAGIADLLARIWEVTGVEALGLSTNGTRLAGMARELKQAGVRSVNVSLDALDPHIYRRITGGRLEPVLEGIRAAIDAGFEAVKLNCVLMRGINESQIWPLVGFAAEHGVPLRLIELMPLTRTDVLDDSNFFPVAEAKRLLERRERLMPLPDYRPGHGPAKYFHLEKSDARVGFIGALTDRCFCEGCNKMRLTADGRLRPCLGNHGEIDLAPALRGGSDSDLGALICEGLGRKPLEHAFRENYLPGRPMAAIGG